MARRLVQALVFGIALPLIAACANELPVPAPSFIGTAENSCLPEAILLTEAMHRAGIEAKVLLVVTARWGHALTVFQLADRRTGKPVLWVWDDHYRTLEVAASYDDDMQIATDWLLKSGQNETILSARRL